MTPPDTSSSSAAAAAAAQQHRGGNSRHAWYKVGSQAQQCHPPSTTFLGQPSETNATFFFLLGAGAGVTAAAAAAAATPRHCRVWLCRGGSGGGRECDSCRGDNDNDIVAGASGLLRPGCCAERFPATTAASGGSSFQSPKPCKAQRKAAQTTGKGGTETSLVEKFSDTGPSWPWPPSPCLSFPV